MKTFGRRTLSIILSLIMLFSCYAGLTFSVNGLETKISGDYEYLVLGNRIVGIKKYNGVDEDVIIPAELDGNKVTNILDHAFSGSASIKSITIPSSVHTIANGAFVGCSLLKSINVSEDNASFQSIVGVLFNKSMTKIIAYPCGRAGEYAIPDGVSEIGDYAFSVCQRLHHVDRSCRSGLPK